MALKRKYDIAGVWFGSSRIEDSRNDPPLSFGCNFSREQMTGIVACANAYHLFCVSTLRIPPHEFLRTRSAAVIPYVILAACRRGERAYEEEVSGWFTRVLLESLQANGSRMGTMSYQDLMQSIPRIHE